MNYYITHCDENFIEHVEKLFETHNLFSDCKLIFFSVNFEYKSKYKNIISIPFNSYKNKSNNLSDPKANSVFLKPLIAKEFLNLPFISNEDVGCYVDADCLFLKNCDNIFNHSKRIIDYPLLNEGCHDFMLRDNRGNPFINGDCDLNLTLEAPLIKLLGFDVNKRGKYLQTGVFLFNNNCLTFLNSWAELCQNEKILSNWEYLTPFHEETIINCIFWQLANVESLSQVLINIPYYSEQDDDLIKVKDLFNQLKNPGLEDKFIYTFTKIPKASKVENVFFLHGKHSKTVYNYIFSNLQDPNINKTMTRIDLINLFQEHNLIGDGVEVGSFKGEYAKEILKIWKGKLFLIDVWKNLDVNEYKDASNTNEYKSIINSCCDNIANEEHRCYMIRSNSVDASKLFLDDSLDFIYIDANHRYEYVKQDLSIWFPKLRKGGVFAGHDYLKIDWYNDKSHATHPKDKHIWTNNVNTGQFDIYCGEFGVNPAVDEFCAQNNYKLNLTNEWFGSWYFIK